MILTRLGNKKGLKSSLATNFPKHRLRIEYFFGAGGSFFYLPKPKFSILNDFDDDVTNLYLVLLDQKEELIKQIEMMPISESLIKHYKNNLETHPIRKAIRFLLLSNFTYLGKGDCLRLGIDHSKRNLLNRIEPTFLMLKDCKITNVDFRDVLKKISFAEDVTPKKDSFGYLDPVYLDTEHNYKVPTWTVNETKACFDIMYNSGINHAMSEFNSEPVLDFASDYKMNVIKLKNRRNLKNNRHEILITNYNLTPKTIYSLDL